MTTYRIVRIYFNNRYAKRAVKGMKHLTEEEAQAHCRNPETSSRTCTSKEGKARTASRGAWFDCFEEET